MLILIKSDSDTFTSQCQYGRTRFSSILNKYQNTEMFFLFVSVSQGWSTTVQNGAKRLGQKALTENVYPTHTDQTNSSIYYSPERQDLSATPVCQKKKKKKKQKNACCNK